MARVTVVNDSEEFFGLMGDVLAELGHEGTTLKGETVTVGEIAATEPDAIVVDLRLGDASVLMDGWAIVVGARTHPELKNVPLVICSADIVFLRERADEIAAWPTSIRSRSRSASRTLRRSLTDYCREASTPAADGSSRELATATLASSSMTRPTCAPQSPMRSPMTVLS